MKKTNHLFYQILCVAIGILLMIPIIYAINISFMPQSEILTTRLQFFPKTLGYLDNYKVVFTNTRVLRFMFNSLIMAGISSIVRVIIASLAAFSFSFFEYKGKKILFTLVVVSMIIPADVLVVQNYFTTAEFGLINTYLGMMVVFFISGINIFVMRQNFLSYSITLKEAALVDGCTNFKFYRKILMPSNVPVITTVFISSFVGTWNTYLWPLLVTNSDSMRTAHFSSISVSFPVIPTPNCRWSDGWCSQRMSVSKTG